MNKDAMSFKVDKWGDIHMNVTPLLRLRTMGSMKENIRPLNNLRKNAKIFVNKQRFDLFKT